MAISFLTASRPVPLSPGCAANFWRQGGTRLGTCRGIWYGTCERGLGRSGYKV